MLRLVDRVLAWVGWGLAALVVALLIAGPGLIGADNGAPVAPASYSGAGRARRPGTVGRPKPSAPCSPRTAEAATHSPPPARASGGPNLDDLQAERRSRAEIVTSGSGSMPSFQGRLDAAQVRALADYVASTAGG